jgi:pimeloyl-ACP methyl ester carboxylesterase
MSAIILDNEIVHYEVLGRGRPVLFLHGWVGSWRYWLQSMQAASTDYRSYAIDLWGFGGTAKSPNKYLLSSQYELLNSFLYEMGIGKIALIGHGLGAVVSILFTEQYPNLVDRVMAIGVPFETSMINPRLLHSSQKDLADWLLGSGPEMEPARIEAPKTDHNAVIRTIHNLNSLELLEILNHVSTPCLFVNGVDDPAISTPEQDKISQFPQNFHTITFNQSGHFPMLKQPNKFNRLLFDFLSLESGKNPSHLQLREEWKRRIR